MSRRSRRRTSAPSTIVDMLEAAPATVPEPGRPLATDDPIPDDDVEWEPRPLARAVRSRRTFRISVVLMAISLGVGAYYLIQMLLDIPEQRAAARRTEYHERLEALDAVIPDLHDVAVHVTDPEQGTVIRGLQPIVDLEDRAADVHTIASEPLPSVPPLAPTGAIDELALIQARMLAIVDRSETISKRLSDTISYRQAFDRAFRLPTLPLTTAGPGIDQVTEDLAVMLATSVEAAANLPDDDFFAVHRGDVDALIEWLTDWQTEYVTALRLGDTDRAGGLVADATRQVELIGVGLGGPLTEAQEWSMQAVDELDREIDDALLLTE